MAFTNQQIQAINTRGMNIIVSAGAGSGKTAVLSERVLEYCKNGGDIKKILVLTFTKAAAAEMKDRIRKNLIKSSTNENLDEETKNRLKEAANDIDLSYITTFDAYSQALVKKYYYALDLSKNISVLDGSVAELKKNQIIDEIFDELYEKQDEEFYSFITKFVTQDDNNVKDSIKEIWESLDLLIDFDEIYNGYSEKYFSIDNINNLINEYLNLIKSKVEYFKEALYQLKDLAATDTASEKIYDEASHFIDELLKANTYEDYKSAFEMCGLSRVSNKAIQGVKDLKHEVSDLQKKFVDAYFSHYASNQDMIDEINSIKDDSIYILKICKELNDRFYEYKRSVMSFTFSDIARFAIKLVKENKEILEETKNSFNEILVDEYQDTSDIQETFLSLISNNNLFMVGDIKQSIYRFRNANPYIFKEKYDNYSNNKGGLKIDLTKNFRSRSEVLDNINLIFKELMTNELGDADYKAGHEMIYGQLDYESEKTNYDYNMEVLKYQFDKDIGFKEADDEAFIIAKKIKEIHDSKIKVLKGRDKTTDKPIYKEVSYNDFAILIRTKEDFNTFKKVFDYLSIPLVIEDSLDLKDSKIPYIFINFLILINEYQKVKDKNNIFSQLQKKAIYRHAKVAIARSFLYQYPENIIFQMMNSNQYTPLDDDIIYLAELKDISYSDLFYQICHKTDIYSKLSYIGEVDNSLEIMKTMHSLFQSFQILSMNLDEATKNLKEILDSDNYKLEYSVSSNIKDSVRLMSIHKSKGLEFPFCFIPRLNKEFNTSDAKKKFGFSKKYGIYLPSVDEGESNTIIKSLIANEINTETISEQVRLLYVALTRAREKLFLIYNEKDDKSNEVNVLDIKSFKDFLLFSKVIKPYTKELDLDEYNITMDYKKKNKDKDIPSGNIKLGNYKEGVIELIEGDHASKVSYMPSTKESKANKDLGNDFHHALEVINLKKPDIDNLPVSDFIKNKIKILLTNPIFSNIKNGKDYHEYEFYYLKDEKENHGIIDLFVVYDDHVDIIDYKLSHTDDLEYQKQLNDYKNFLSSKYTLPINIYLLSILNNEIKKMN